MSLMVKGCGIRANDYGNTRKRMAHGIVATACWKGASVAVSHLL